MFVDLRTDTTRSLHLPPVPVPEEGGTLWHYTIGAYLLAIARDGVLRPNRAGMPQAARPLLWLSTHPLWEPSACKLLPAVDGTVVTATFDGAHFFGNGLIRIAMPSRRDIYPWKLLVRLMQIPPAVVREQTQVAALLGGSIQDWWATAQPVAQGEWGRMERWAYDHWVPGTLTDHLDAQLASRAPSPEDREALHRAVAADDATLQTRIIPGGAFLSKEAKARIAAARLDLTLLPMGHFTGIWGDLPGATWLMDTGRLSVVWCTPEAQVMLAQRGGGLCLTTPEELGLEPFEPPPEVLARLGRDGHSAAAVNPVALMRALETIAALSRL